MACSANLLCSLAPAGAPGLAQTQKSTQLIAGPQKGISSQHITKSASKQYSPVKSQSFSYLFYQSSFSFKFPQKHLPLGDVFLQRCGCCHGILQLLLEQESRTASASAVAAPSHLQSHPSSPPARSQLAVRELCFQGSFASPLVPCRRQHHVLVMQLLLRYVLCVTAQPTAQQLGFRTDPGRMANWREVNKYTQLRSTFH